jgi:putative membrane protein
MNTNFRFSNLQWRIGLLILLHIFGVVALLVPIFQPLFDIGTPYHLLGINLVLCWDKNLLGSNKFFYFLFSAYTIGFLAEVIGVNTGLLFGQYRYTEALGLQLFNVPLLIVITWAGTALACNAISRFWTQSIYLNSILGALLMVAFDYILEFFATSVPLWTWQNNLIPFYNYVCWFLIGLPVSFLVHFFNAYTSARVSMVFLLSQVVFFIAYLYIQ